MEINYSRKQVKDNFKFLLFSFVGKRGWRGRGGGGEGEGQGEGVLLVKEV